MRDDEAFLGIAITGMMVGGAIAIYSLWQKERRARRQERHELLRGALQHPQLDELTRAELLRAIAREQDTGVPRLFGVLRTVWFAAGWMSFVMGSGMALLDAMDMVRIDGGSAAAAGLAGFAMLTLPLGLRELQRRDDAAAGRRESRT